MTLQTVGRLMTATFTLCALAVGAGSAAAQSTMTLTDSNATTLRGGSYAASNFSKDQILETRASSDLSYVRRGLLKFDTHSTLPQGTKITSATLTLTVAGGNAQTRTLSAYAENAPYDEAAANWNQRKSGTKWSKAGGDIGARYDTASITSTVGSKVTFDVTALVQAVVRGDFDPSSRYTRIELIDEGGASRDSYKQIYSDEATTVALRPTLKIAYGAATSGSTSGSSGSTSGSSSSSTASGSTLRVLQWNTHHGGYGTDGKYNTDRVATWIVRMQPDVVTLNEIEKFTSWGNQNQPEVYKSLLQAKTGKTWYYVFAQEYGSWSANGKGNLILSTVPLVAIDRHELVRNADRSIAEAIINWGGRQITLMSTHLDPDSLALRLIQATEVTTWAAAEPENKILTGDMNAWPDQSSIAQLNKFFYDSWAIAASKGTTVAFSGNDGQTKNGRIDYIYYSKSAKLSVKSSQVYDTRDSKGVMPSDHRPVLTVFTVQ
jgi:endonuclease/exonuclease/phosphatase family metal-dependent hydrolase